MPGEAVFSGSVITGVAVQDSVVVAVGFNELEDGSGIVGHAWWSPSAGPWSQADIVGLTDAPSGIATPGGFLATGGLYGGCLSGLWSSTDGRAWSCDPPAAGFNWIEPTVVAAFDTVEIAPGAWFSGATPESTAPPESSAFFYRPLP